MVQIIDENKRSFLGSLLGGVAGGAQSGVQLAPQLIKLQQQQKQQDFLQQLINRGRQSQSDGNTSQSTGSTGQAGVGQPTQINNGLPFSNEDILAADMADPTGHLARDMQAQNSEANANRREKRKEEIGFHQESQKYDEELQNKTRIAKKQVETIKDMEKSLKSNKITPKSAANIFRGMGKIGDKIADALLNSDEATFLASIPQLLEGWKEVFGVRLSDADLRVLQDKLPSIGKSPEANRAILGIMRKYADQTLLRETIAKDIKAKNSGLRPLGYADAIETRFDEMTKDISIVNPNTGRIIQIPAYKLSDAIKAGAKLAE